MIRKAEIEGEACSTCRFAEFRADHALYLPWYECTKHKGEVIYRPDDLVCDRFEHIP